MSGRTAAVSREGEQGFLLLAVVITVAVLLIMLAVATPRMAHQLERDKEEESVHRAKQYVRAIQLYYRSVNSYPTSIDQLMNTNNRKFLRQKYKDPLTGGDYRLIHLGEQKTQVKGFFGKPLDGAAPGSLGTAAGMVSPTNNTGQGIAGSSTAGSTPGQSGSNSPFGSHDATTFGANNGPIVGVGTTKKGDAVIEWNGSKKMEDWEFLYDPRPDAIRNQISLFGGSPPVSGGSSLGGGIANGSTAAGSSSGFGSSNSFGSSGSGGFGSSSSSPFGGSSTLGGSSPFGSPTGENTGGSGSGASPSSGSSGSSGTVPSGAGNGTPPQ